MPTPSMKEEEKQRILLRLGSLQHWPHPTLSFFLSVELCPSCSSSSSSSSSSSDQSSDAAASAAGSLHRRNEHRCIHRCRCRYRCRAAMVVAVHKAKPSKQVHPHVSEKHNESGHVIHFASREAHMCKITVPSQQQQKQQLKTTTETAA